MKVWEEREGTEKNRYWVCHSDSGIRIGYVYPHNDMFVGEVDGGGPVVVDERQSNFGTLSEVQAAVEAMYDKIHG